MESNPSESSITIVCGANIQPINLGPEEALTVGNVRERLGEVMNIAPNSIAALRGETVEDGLLLKAGDRLEFIKASGTKG